MSVKKIPIKDQSLLCASVYINSFQKAVEELVYNSLDADSTSIAIRVCLQENFIQVLDNGIGISKDNFRLLGHKYATSKFVDVTTLKSAPDKFGFRGMSLASIIEISQTVKICSKFTNSDETWMKTFCKGKEENAYLTTERPSKGTTVEIMGFLYNLNIQKKSIDPVKELHNIKLSLEQLSLVHCNVSISLRDDSKNEIIYRINKNRDIYQTLESLFDIKWKDFQDLQVEKNQYKVKAIIGNQNENLKKYQWLYLNGKIVFKTRLHKKLNNYFTTTNKINKKIKNKNKFADENIMFNSNLPFYFIFISCPYIDFDIIYKNKQTFVEFKNWQEIDKLIEKLVQVYHGSKSLKLIKYDENIKINESECGENDTRKKVRTIMERILNKNNINKPKISQLRKGVKGKNIKRKKKKMADISWDKITKKRDNIKSKQLSNNKLKQRNEIINLSRVIDPKKFEKSRDQIIISEDTQVHLKLTPKNSQKNVIFNEKFTKLNKHKDFIHRDKIINYQKPLLDKFAEQTESIKKRCKVLSYEAKQNLKNIKTKNDRHEYTKMECKNVFNDSGNRHFYMETYEYSTINSNYYNNPKKYIYEDQENHVIKNNCNIKQCKTSYDLIKPVTDLVIPANAKTRAKVNENVIFKQYNQSYFASYEPSIHIATFNSHQNIIHSLCHEEKQNKVRYSTTTKTQKNIFLKEKKSHQTLNKNINKEKMRKKHNLKKIFETAMNLATESFKTPIYSSDLDMDVSNNIKVQGDITANLENHSKDFVQNVNSTLNINYESTYTIEVLDKSMITNRQYNETYTIQNHKYTRKDTERDYSPSLFTRNETLPFDKSVNKSIYFVSESQSYGVESLDPLNYCETVLNINNLHYIKKGINNETEVRTQIVREQSQNNAEEKLQTDFNNIDLNGDKNQDTEILSPVTFFNNVENNFNNQKNSKKNSNKLIKELLKINDINKTSNDLNTFQLKARHSFVPKGMSPIFKNSMQKTSYNYDMQLDYYDNDIYKNFAEDVRINHEIFEADVLNIRDVATKDINNVNNIIRKDHADLIFDSTSLKYVKVLNQVDTKFIACLLRDNSTEDDKHSVFLALFDQHAVDERVRLENNLKDYFDGNEWKSVPIDSEIKINLTKENLLYFHNHKEKFSAFGLQWTLNDNEILVNAIPEAILGKNVREVDTVIKAVKNLILEQIDVIKSLRGNVSSYPTTIMDLVFSEACRYAIKFGDKLTKTDCVEMVNKLSDCKTPFQCAHGRPVMAILTELTDMNIDYKVNFNKINEFKNKQVLCNI